MNCIPSSRHPAQRARASGSAQTGFSLVELMVGIVIGMIAIIVIAQVFRLSEGFKRTTTGVDDATSNGAIALVGLQRDLKQTGYAMNSATLSGCNLSLPAPAGWTINTVAPVTINHPDIPAGDPATDTLMVMYGSGAGSPEGERVQGQPAINEYVVEAPAAYQAGDRIVAVNDPAPSPCVVAVELAASAPAASAVGVPVGRASMLNGLLFNLGPAPRVLVYAVRGGNLTLCDFIANDCSLPDNADDETVWVPIASNIVGLRAQYGRDTTAPMDAAVDVYDQIAPVDTCARVRISAVRLALVARSGQLERELAPGTPVTQAAPTWSGSAVDPPNQTLPIVLTSNPQWQNYRYRVFETTVPVRNVTWQGVQAGC